MNTDRNNEIVEMMRSGRNEKRRDKRKTEETDGKRKIYLYKVYCIDIYL